MDAQHANLKREHPIVMDRLFKGITNIYIRTFKHFDEDITFTWLNKRLLL